MVYGFLVFFVILAYCFFMLYRDKKKTIRERRMSHFNEHMRLKCTSCGFERTPESYAEEFDSTSGFPFKHWFGYNGKSYCPTCNKLELWK
jgi:hypothetical protein